MLEHWFEQDLKTLVRVNHISGNMFSQDNRANKIVVKIFRDGEPVTLSGTLSANVILPDNSTLLIESGTISGNEASIVLPEEAYDYPGMISIFLKLSSGSSVITICSVTAVVYPSPIVTVP